MNRTLTLLRSVVLAVGTASVISQSASAIEIGYELGIGTDLQLLSDPESTQAQAIAASKTSAGISVARETPLFRLTNTSTEAEVTELSIDINNDRYVFDAMIVAESPHGMNVQLRNPHESQHSNGTTSVLTLSFEDQPLRPSESFAFWLDIDPAQHAVGMGFVDYRNILFDLGGYDRADNTIVNVTFDNGADSSIPLYDFFLGNATYDSTSEDGTRGTSYAYVLEHGNDAIGSFFINHVDHLEVSPVPEPSSMGIILLGMAAFWQNAIQRVRRR